MILGVRACTPLFATTPRTRQAHRTPGPWLEETRDSDKIIQRVAALDVGKAELTCCVRVPGQGGSGRRLQEVRTYQTMTRWLLVMADRLRELG
jgi:hypothetical protein